MLMSHGRIAPSAGVGVLAMIESGTSMRVRIWPKVGLLGSASISWISSTSRAEFQRVLPFGVRPAKLEPELGLPGVM